jgi:pyridinium-3,5-bisthiocarboxylic acid mononucleotide nickel chelatase
MTRIAYFDCFSGCSGDMILGALLDAGLPLQDLKSGLASLDVEGYRLTAEKVKRSSITATKFNVMIDEHSHHHSRSLTDILHIIDSSKLSVKIKKSSRDIFQRLGEIEAGIHGVPVEQIHFHEIGAVDSIVDIVGTVLAFDLLNIERFYSSPMPMGNGNISTAHGILPVPAPATLKLLSLAQAPLVNLPSQDTVAGELVTPTGAVLVTYLSSFKRPDMTVDKVGYGAGSRDISAWPNILRIWLGEEKEDSSDQTLVLLETNIDDMNPQIYGYLMEKLLSEQAADVWFTPIQMKKNRPAIMLSVLAPSQYESLMIEIIMRETSTLGIRSRSVSRHIAQREIIEFESSLGHVKAKIKRFSKDVFNISPEYEDCRIIATERNIPLQEVLRIIEAEARQHLNQ